MSIVVEDRAKDIRRIDAAALHAVIAVVIPCYRVRSHVLEVIASIPKWVDLIIVVDDACPEDTGSEVERHCQDPRVKVLRNPRNMGVGGAVIAGYREALAQSATIVVKIDGDGQMDPGLLEIFLMPLVHGDADYVKGNRFHDLTAIGRMPTIRIFGNAMLSFMAKASSGYWDLFDPTNGYTAIHVDALRRLPLDKVSERYFFETDLLFRLYTIGAVVEDVPMEARYGDEQSNLRIGRVLGPFLLGHTRNVCKRIFYKYFLREFSVASLELVVGSILLLFAVIFGGYHWWRSIETGIANPLGTVIISALSVLAGLQLVLAFLGFDMASSPRRPLQRG